MKQVKGDFMFSGNEIYQSDLKKYWGLDSSGASYARTRLIPVSCRKARNINCKKLSFIRGSRFRQNAKFGHFTLLFATGDGIEMYQELLCTYTAIVLLIPFAV